MEYVDGGERDASVGLRSCVLQLVWIVVMSIQLLLMLEIGLRPEGPSSSVPISAVLIAGLVCGLGLLLRSIGRIEWGSASGMARTMHANFKSTSQLWRGGMLVNLCLAVILLIAGQAWIDSKLSGAPSQVGSRYYNTAHSAPVEISEAEYWRAENSERLSLASGVTAGYLISLVGSLAPSQRRTRTTQQASDLHRSS